MKFFPRTIWAAAWLAIFPAGCAVTRTLDIAGNNAAAISRDPDGTPVLRSQLKHTVAVRPLTEKFSRELRSLPSFSVIVTNGGRVAVPLAPEDITVFSGAQPVTIFDEPTLQRRIEQEAAVAVRVSPPLAEFRDATQTGEPTYSSPRSDNSRWVTEEARRVMVKDSPGSPIEPLAMPLDPPPYRLQREALKLQTIAPENIGGGRVTLDAATIAAGAPLRMVVNFDGEAHTFWFVVK